MGRILAGAALLSVLAVSLSGCAGFHSCTRADKGDLIAHKSLRLWPVFQAESRRYTNGVEREGDALLTIIRWHTWQEKKAERDARAAAAAPAGVT